MALARSASGPGGLSINTNSANSLFGSGTTPAAGGMFANTQTSKPAQAGGLFGTATTTQAQSGGLFGTAPASQPATGGLFGAAQPQQTGGLFGSSTATSQPQSGGLFGAANISQPAQAGGLFGSSTAAQPQQTGGMFSGLGSQPAQATGGGLFGASTSQPAQPSQGGGLFGGLNNNPNQAKPAQSLFGGPGNTQSQNTFGNTLGGGSTTNQQQTVPGVRIDASNVRGTTRFNDLHEDLQKILINADAYIQAQIQLKNDCDAIMPSHEAQLKQVPYDVEFCARKLIGVQNAADEDTQAIHMVQKLIKTDVENAKLSFKAIDNLKLPPQYHTNSIWSAKSASNDNQAQNSEGDAQDIVEFFSKTADDLAVTLSSYQKHITDIEQHLRGVEASSVKQMNDLVAKRNGRTGAQEDSAEELTWALRDFENGLLGVAGKVGAAREGLQILQLNQFPPPNNGSRRGPRSGVY